MQATATVTASALNTPKKEINMTEKLHVVPDETKSSVVEAFDNYPIVAAITGWDQIGSLSSEVSTSLLAKQASIICERFREENSSREPERPSKRRKIGTSSDEEDSSDDEQQVVSCDEHSSTSSESLPGCVSHQVDRMARMSKLILKMESYHRLVRKEIIAMAKDSGIDLLEFS
jgi:hypothetical protein